MESYPFQEGELFGGPVLFQEPVEHLERRRSADKLLIVVIFLILFLVIPVPVALVGGPDVFWIVAILLAVMSGLLVPVIYLALRHMKSLSKLMVCREGLSLGAGNRPFYKFSDIYQIEETIFYDSESHSNPCIGITFTDGNYEIIDRRIFRTRELYERFLDASRSRSSKTRKAFPWSKDALGLMSQLQGGKGPIRYAIELSARSHGFKEVTLDFIRSNWQEIVKERKYHPEEFKMLAKRLWGRIRTGSP
ncbi:MAG: hypothetical protein FJ149_02600 [Euryarchaeota archaeon]|nr:hypothetical protein [Euryarchaeota archaeon]